MVFTSVAFTVFFLPAVILVYNVVPQRLIHVRNAVLLAFSLVFYAWGGVGYLSLLLVSVAINYLAGLAIGAAKTGKRILPRGVLCVAVFLNLALLGVFKYANFFTGILAGFGVGKATSIALPIGISFFTFQGMSYVFDVYRGQAEVAKNPLKVALYISLFPQLVAGPIVRYTDVEAELASRHVSPSDFAEGAIRFMLGYGKKLLLANAMGEIADRAFSRTGTELLSSPLAWLGAVGFALQIYFDFSAYSDMAIGLGRMLGFHFNENFDYPYVSSSVTEFWRRWHISLSTWFRDYLYIPLGGNRCRVPRQIFNLLVVWSLTGLWHGANWTFIVWGLWYGALLIIEKFVIGKRIERIPRVIRHAVTLILVLIGWVLFRSDTLGNAVEYVRAMFGFRFADVREFVFLLREYTVELVVSLVAIFPIKKIILSRLGGKRASPVLQILTASFSFVVFGAAYMRLVSGSFMPFIYFQF